MEQQNQSLKFFKKSSCQIIPNFAIAKFAPALRQGSHEKIRQGFFRLCPEKCQRHFRDLTAREIFKKFPRLRRELWGGEFWSDGKYVGTVGEGGNKNVIERYIERQGSPPEETQLTFWL